MIMTCHRPVLSVSLLLACAPLDAADDDGDAGSSDDTGAALEPLIGPPRLDEPCSGEVADPTRLVVTTNDGVTGAVTVVDLRTGEVTPDLALASSDAIPFYHDGRVHVLQRYAFDALDVLAGADLRLLGQVSLAVDGVVSSNPHALAFGPGARAHVALFGAPAVQVLDLADPAAPRVVGTIDLRALADADGNPEASLAIRCGDVLFVSIERLDAAKGLIPIDDQDHLAAVDLATGRLHDLDPDAPGVQSAPLLGPWAKQWRLDPDDPAGHTAYVLSSGLERVDLADLTSAWAVTPARLAAALGGDDYRLPQAFDLADDGATAILAGYRADYSEVVLLRASLDDDAPLTEIAGGMQSIERTLEVVDDTLWFGDRTTAAAGMRAWDLTTDPPTPRFGGAPLSTGLAPYAAVAVP